MRTLATLALLLALPVRAEVVLTAPHCDVCTAEGPDGEATTVTIVVPPPP